MQTLWHLIQIGKTMTREEILTQTGFIVTVCQQTKVFHNNITEETKDSSPPGVAL